MRAATLMGSTMSGNTAGNGGGIYKTVAPLFVMNSTISGNYSTVNGGAIYASAGMTSLLNATIAHNRANSDNSDFAYGGGGL